MRHSQHARHTTMDDRWRARRRDEKQGGSRVSAARAAGMKSRGKQGVCCSRQLRAAAQLRSRRAWGVPPSVRPLPPRSARPQLRAAAQLRSRRAWGVPPSVRPLPPRSPRPQLRAAAQLRSRRAWGVPPSVRPLPPRSARPQLRAAAQLRSRRAWGVPPSVLPLPPRSARPQLRAAAQLRVGGVTTHWFVVRRALLRGGFTILNPFLTDCSG